MKDYDVLGDTALLNNAEIVAQLLQELRGLGLSKPVKGRGVISGVVSHPLQGYPLSAIAQINGVDNQIVEVGANHRIVEGEVWDFVAEDDDNIGRIWLPRRLIVTDQVSVAPDNTRPFPTLVVPSDGVVVVRDQNYLTDPNGPVNTRVYINYRTIIPGIVGYDVFGFGMRKVHIQIRELGTLIWGFLNSVPIRPSETFGSKLGPVFLLLATAAFTPTDTSLAVDIPRGLDVTKFIIGQPVYWKINDETFDGIYNGAGSITTIINRSPNPSADHAIGSKITLLSGQIDVGGLRAGLTNADGTATNIDYQAQIAAGDSFDNHGPFSAFIPFSGFRIIAPPAHVTNLVVNQIKAGANLSWTKPTAANLKGFNIYRSTIAVTDDTEIADDTSLPGTMRKIATLSRNQTTFIVPAADPAAIYYQGDYIGVEVVDTTGNRSLVRWDLDDNPPPNPDPDNVTYEPGAFSITVNIASADTAAADEGFKEYVLYRASGTPGTPTSITEIARFSSSAYTFSVSPEQDAKIYQLVSADWVGNVGTRTNDTDHWKYVPAFYWTDKKPLNGNFHLVNENNSFARYWEVITGSHGGNTMSSAVSWLTTGGVNGNKTIRHTSDGGNDAGDRYFGIRQTIVIPINAFQKLDGYVWIRLTYSGGTPPGSTIYGNLEFDCYSDDAGTTFLGSIANATIEGDLAGPFTSGTWYQLTVPVSSGTVDSYVSGTRTVKAVLIINMPHTATVAYTLDIDDFEVFQSS